MKLAFLTYNRDPSIPAIDNDGNPVTVRNYSYWLAKHGHEIDIFVNKVIPRMASSRYVKEKFKLQRKSMTWLYPGVRIIRVETDDLAAKEICANPELQEIPEIIQSILSSNYFKHYDLSNYDLICIFHPLSSFGVILQNLAPINKTILFPMLLSDEYLKFGDVSPIYIQLEQKILESVYRIFSTSFDEKNRLIMRHIHESKIKVIPRGIDLSSFTYNHKVVPNSGILKLVTVGSLRPQKRQHLLVNLVQNLITKGIDVKLTIIGENKLFTKPEYQDYYNQIKTNITQKNLSDNIIFTGSLESKEVAKLLNASDIALFPSISESFGKAALESICVGTPTIVARECLAYQEFAKNKENCLILPSSTTAFYRGIVNLLKDKDLYTNLSKNGELTREVFSWNRVTKILEDNLIEILTE
jgi:glycosyltransferase involved in cell wall biosynthesis